MYENLYSVTKKLRNDHARVSPQCTQFDEVVRKYMWLVVGIRLFFAASLGLIALLFYYFLR